ncbi:MAG: ribosome-associated translation inhibitor RaiA [Bacillota bacterium]|nr:ribosome-associated translation inhibitor RaiA [Bacillota bacterium]
MRITVRGKNMDVPQAVKEYAEKKIGKMEKYFGGAVTAQVTVSIEKERHIVEVTMPLNGMLVRGEEKAQDLFSAVDLVVEKIEKQIDKYRTRMNNRRSRSSVRASGSAKEFEELDVVKVKHFPLKPMSVDEAIMQMNLLGHDFFVFRDSDTEATAVVYKRKEGNYGLLVPEQ